MSLLSRGAGATARQSNRVPGANGCQLVAGVATAGYRPGRPQIEYSEWSDQWVPRGHVLRCHIEDDEEGKPIIHVDDVELDLEAFGRMLRKRLPYPILPFSPI